MKFPLALLLMLLTFTSAGDDFGEAVAAYANADYEKAYQLWRPLAESGDAGAMFDLGVLYWEGQGIPRNRSLAIKWWQRAAQRDVAAAHYNLSLAHYLGEEVPQDTQKALALARLAAKQEHDYATRILSILEQDTAAPNPPDNIQFGYSGTAVGEAIAKLYAGRNTGTTVVGTISVGTPIRVLSGDSSWSRVEVPGGIRVWVFGKYVTSAGTEYKISGIGVRARTAPTTDKSSSVVGTLKTDAIVDVIKKKDDWTQIRAPSSIAIWIPTQHIQVIQELTEEWKEEWEAARARRVIRGTSAPALRAVLETNKSLPENGGAEPSKATAAMPAFRAATVSAKVAEVVGGREHSAQLLKLLTRNTPVRIMEEQGAWAKVEVPTGLYVWVYGKYLSEHEGGSVINTDHVRARSLPSTKPNSSVVGIFSKGTDVLFVSRQGDWRRVKAVESVAGWVRLDQLTVLDSTTDAWLAKWSKYRAEF